MDGKPPIEAFSESILGQMTPYLIRHAGVNSSLYGYSITWQLSRNRAILQRLLGRRVDRHLSSRQQRQKRRAFAEHRSQVRNRLAYADHFLLERFWPFRGTLRSRLARTLSGHELGKLGPIHCPGPNPVAKKKIKELLPSS